MYRWVVGIVIMHVFVLSVWAQPPQMQVVVQTGQVVSGKILGNIWGLAQFTETGELVYYADTDGANGRASVFSTTQGLLAFPGQRVQGGTLVTAGFAGLTSQDVPILTGTYNPPAGVADAIYTPTHWLLDTNTPVTTGTLIEGHRLYSIEAATVNGAGTIVYVGLTDRPDHAVENGVAQVGAGWLARPGTMIDGQLIAFVAPWGLGQNASGQVIFLGAVDQTWQTQGLFTPQHAVVMPGDLIMGHPVHSVWVAALSDAGEIVYEATLDDREVLVSTTRGVLAQTGTEVHGHTLHHFDWSTLALNTSGEVLWMGQYDDTQFGLFSSERGLLLRDGQALLGKTILSVVDAVLNPQGQMAVGVWFTDGSDAIVLLPPPSWRVVVFGDFNGDGRQDMAGVDDDSTLWRCLAGKGCAQLPGRAIDLVAGDFDGDGRDDLVALAGDTTIWAMTDTQRWRQLPGRLKSLVAGHLTSKTQTQLAGVGWDTSLWLAPTLGQWQQLPGRLRLMVSGDFTGDGYDDLAGLGWDTTIWVMPHGQPWRQLQGRLIALDADGNILEGRSADGRHWQSVSLGPWMQQ